MATDSTNFIGNKFGVSKAFDYTLKPSAVNGRSYRVSVNPSNSSGTGFAPSSTIIWNIPCGMRKNTFIDPTSSYVRFSVKSTASATTSSSIVLGNSLTAVSTGAGTASINGAGAFLDHNAYSIFNTQTLYSGSNQLENISGVNILYSYMLDTNFSYSNALSNSLNYGMYVPTIDSQEIRKGTFLSQIAVGTAAGSASASAYGNETNTYSMPLLSGLLGIGATSMVPAYAINDVLRLEILLESAQKALVTAGTFQGFTSPTWSATAPTYMVVSAVLELTYIELSDLGMSIVNQSTPSGSAIFLVGQSARRNTQTLPASSSGLYSALIPSKLASLRSIHVLPRRSVEDTAADSYSLSSRINPNWEYVYFSISGVNVPQTPITLINPSNTGGFGEALCELNKCFQSLTATDKATLLTSTNYNVAVTSNISGVAQTGVLGPSAGLESYKNAFAIGLDLQLFHSATEIITGVNTLNESLYINASSSGSGSNSFNLDIFCLFDALFIVDQTGYVSLRC
jgi:hypothetical protein